MAERKIVLEIDFKALCNKNVRACSVEVNPIFEFQQGKLFECIVTFL